MSDDLAVEDGPNEDVPEDLNGSRHWSGDRLRGPQQRQTSYGSLGDRDVWNSPGD